MQGINEWAKRYRQMGFAICRIESGKKRPTYKGWNRYSLEPDQLREGQNIGLQAGKLSRDLVCLDIDDREVLGQADKYLPQTSMEEGRPGKPRSHRWFRVKNVPAELTARPEVAGGIGGPRTRRLRGPGRMLLEFLGTGGQAVVPASVWTSEDGQHRELRRWDRFAEPPVIDCRELFEAACRLASAFGWVDKERSGGRRRKPKEAEAASRLPMTTGRAARLARSYVRKMAPAVSGKGGDAQTYLVACVLVLDFGLTPEDALPIMLEFNDRCSPRWSMDDLQRKLAAADAQDREGRGWRVLKSNHAIEVSLSSDGPVIIGLDVAAPDRSYVDLSPSLYAGVVKTPQGWELSPELDVIEWEGKEVVLAPASTITTNTREVWGEFFLARLLRQRGACVQSLRLPTLNGRRRTLGKAGDVNWRLIDPPWNSAGAVESAEKAMQEQRRVDAYRRSLPRNKPSPKLAKAMRFLRKQAVTTVTKDVVKKGKRRRITEATLKRAMSCMNTTNTFPSSLPVKYISLFEPGKSHLKQAPATGWGDEHAQYSKPGFPVSAVRGTS